MSDEKSKSDPGSGPASSHKSKPITSSGSVTNAIEIVCTTCYIKGKATSKFTIDEEFNATQAMQNFTRDVVDEISGLGRQAIDYVDHYMDTVKANLDDGFDIEDFDLPPIGLDFNVDLPEIPECHLQFKFEDLDIYILLDTILTTSATYKLNLYTSNTPIGLGIGDDLTIGVVFSIDLILNVDGDIDISSGFHLKLDKGVSLDIALFSDDISEITL